MKIFHCFIKWSKASYALSIKSKDTNDKVINGGERKYVPWVMGHSSFVPENNKIFLNLMQYHYLGIEVLGSYCGLRLES